MTTLFSLIIVLSLILGFIYGWSQDADGIHMLISVIVSGFLGSCVAAIVFTYHYFTHEETGKEKIQRLKHEIKQFKQENE